MSTTYHEIRFVTVEGAIIGIQIDVPDGLTEDQLDSVADALQERTDELIESLYPAEDCSTPDEAPSADNKSPEVDDFIHLADAIADIFEPISGLISHVFSSNPDGCLHCESSDVSRLGLCGDCGKWQW